MIQIRYVSLKISLDLVFHCGGVDSHHYIEVKIKNIRGVRWTKPTQQISFLSSLHILSEEIPFLQHYQIDADNFPVTWSLIVSSIVTGTAITTIIYLSPKSSFFILFLRLIWFNTDIFQIQTLFCFKPLEWDNWLHILHNKIKLKKSICIFFFQWRI